MQERPESFKPSLPTESKIGMDSHAHINAQWQTNALHETWGRSGTSESGLASGRTKSLRSGNDSNATSSGDIDFGSPFKTNDKNQVPIPKPDLNKQHSGTKLIDEFETLPLDVKPGVDKPGAKPPEKDAAALTPEAAAEKVSKLMEKYGAGISDEKETATLKKAFKDLVNGDLESLKTVAGTGASLNFASALRDMGFAVKMTPDACNTAPIQSERQTLEILPQVARREFD